MGIIGVKKKKYSFHIRKCNVIDSKGSISRIEKLMSEKFMHNVGVTKCCTTNCCQHFPHEKTLLLREEFSSLSFEDCKTCGLDILRRLHTGGIGSGLKFNTIQGLDICEIAWYYIVGFSKSTYMLYKLNNK